jgi:hypothetical protein
MMEGVYRILFCPITYYYYYYYYFTLDIDARSNLVEVQTLMLEGLGFLNVLMPL